MSDFSKKLAEVSFSQDEAEAGYQTLTQQNKFTKVSKDQDVKYKEQESSGLKEAASELTSDKDSASAELSAVVQHHQAECHVRCQGHERGEVAQACC